MAAKTGHLGMAGQAARFRNRIVGVVRFSYVSLNGFAKTPADSGSAAAMLFDRSRLTRRFNLFEALTLPSLVAQDDGDFETLVVTSPDLPAWARERLDDRIAGLRGARVVPLAPMLHYTAMQAALADASQHGDTHLTSFRLDDDDAIDRAHVARLRRLSAALLPVCGPEKPFVIGFNRGFYLEIGAAANTLYDAAEKVPVSAGLAMTAPVASRMNIFRRNHRLVGQFLPTFTEADTPAFLRTVHADNDSGALTSGAKGTMPPHQLKTEIADAFPFSMQDLLRIGRDGLPRGLAGPGGT